MIDWTFSARRRAASSVATAPRIAFVASAQEHDRRYGIRDQVDAVSVYVVPTALGVNAAGRAAARRCVAFQPVQWAGTMRSGASPRKASTVGAISGSEADRAEEG